MAERKKYQSLGIDFGATYVRVGYLGTANRVIVPDNREGAAATPAVVIFKETDGGEASVSVGELAKENALVSPESSCSCVLWELGVDTVAMAFQGEDRL